MLEAQYQETGRRMLEGIANNQVTDENVPRMAEDFRQELAVLEALKQISTCFRCRWDRIFSGLIQPTDDELEEMKKDEAKYGATALQECPEKPGKIVAACEAGTFSVDDACPVDIGDYPEGRLVATMSVDSLFQREYAGI